MSRADLIKSFAQGYDRLRAALDELPPLMWDYKPSPKAWSVREIIIHMPDSEASGFVRCRKIIAQPGVTVDVYDQDAFADRLIYRQLSVDKALELFRAMRASTTELLESVDESVWDRYILHPEDGKVTLEQWLQVYDHHVSKHIEQRRRNLRSWENAGRPD